MLLCDASEPVKVVAPPLLHRVSHCQATCPIVNLQRGAGGAFYTFAHLPGGVGLGDRQSEEETPSGDSPTTQTGVGTEIRVVSYVPCIDSLQKLGQFVGTE